MHEGLGVGTTANTARRRFERQACQTLPESGGRAVLGLAECALDGVDAGEVRRGGAFGVVDLRLRGRESLMRVSNA